MNNPCFYCGYTGVEIDHGEPKCMRCGRYWYITRRFEGGE